MINESVMLEKMLEENLETKQLLRELVDATHEQNRILESKGRMLEEIQEDIQEIKENLDTIQQTQLDTFESLGFKNYRTLEDTTDRVTDLLENLVNISYL